MSRIDAAFAAARLAANKDVIRALVAGVSIEQARWRPAPDKWSLLEVIHHLADEEVEDFRTRLGLVLEDPAREWPPIAPVRWANERRYNEQQLAPQLARFVAERERSLSWLANLGDRDWAIEHRHPKIGVLRAGDLLASWVEHDLLHARQLVRLHHEYLATRIGTHSTLYAGEW